MAFGIIMHDENIQQFGASRMKHWQLRTLKHPVCRVIWQKVLTLCPLHSPLRSSDLSGSQDTDSSLSGEESLIQQNVGEVQVRRITVTQTIALLIRSPLVRGGSEAVKTNSSVVVVLHPCPCLHSHSHALGSLLAWELINNSAEHLPVPWAAAKHREHKEGEKNQSLIPSFRSHS